MSLPTFRTPFVVENPELRTNFEEIEAFFATLEKSIVKELLSYIFSSTPGVKVVFGQSEVTYPGGSAISGETVVALPEKASTKAYVFLQPQTVGRYGDVSGATLTQFGVTLISTVGNPPVGTKENFYWLALLT